MSALKPALRVVRLGLSVALALLLVVEWQVTQSPADHDVAATTGDVTGETVSGFDYATNAQGTFLDFCDACELTQQVGPAVLHSAPQPQVPLPTPRAMTLTREPSEAPASYTPAFAVGARAVAIMEAPCGALIYGKSEHAPLPPASLTKIITALATIDHVNLDDSIEVNVSAIDLKKRTRSSVMGLEPGMEVTVEDLLYGLFLPSGNDAALELAEHVGGDVGTFVELMNKEAAGLGLGASHFTNPHGLDARGQRSSARDLAVAAMEMMKNPTLATISSAASYTLDGGLSFNNGNKLLSSYTGAFGVKIGFTDAAGYTIVAAATRDGRDLYAAVLNSDDLYGETARLLDWAFAETSSLCSE